MIRDEIKSAVAKFLETGSTASKVYVRVRPDGSADISEETSWTVSADEYFSRVPHTLSLEIPVEACDYRNLSEGEIEECVDSRFDVAQELVDSWEERIEAWIKAGNLIEEVAHA